MVKIISKILVLSYLCTFICIEAQALENTAPQLSTLLHQAKIATVQRNFQQVVELLEKHELQYGGDANFDYYLGTALLEVKRYSEAIFALERATASQPKFAGAKFELARAHFHNKDYAEAKVLFQKILAMNPPKKLVGVINSYIRTITANENTYKTVHKPSLSFNFGYDSNANNAPDIESIQGVFLADKNQQTSSPFYALHLSDFYSRPIAPDVLWQSQGSFYMRNNPSADFVDMQLIVAQTGLKLIDKDETLTVNFGMMKSNVEGEPLDTGVAGLTGSGVDYQTENLQRSGRFLSLKASTKLSPTSTYSFSAKLAEYRHEPILKLRDITQHIFDFGYRTELTPAWQLSTNLIVANDKVESASSPYGNNRIGVRLAMAHPYNPTLISTMAIKGFKVSYDGLFLGETRDDSQISANYSLNWLASESINYWGKISWLKNHSGNSYGLYSYQTSSIEFGLNYQF